MFCFHFFRNTVTRHYIYYILSAFSIYTVLKHETLCIIHESSELLLKSQTLIQSMSFHDLVGDCLLYDEVCCKFFL